MTSLSIGMAGGAIFGAVAVASMLPLRFADKPAALTAAFLNRFAIGFAIGAAHLTWPGWAVGLTFGLLLSLPEAIITKAWAPILGMGAVGGVLIGVAVSSLGPVSQTVGMVPPSMMYSDPVIVAARGEARTRSSSRSRPASMDARSGYRPARS
jgi:hypothetical protein